MHRLEEHAQVWLEHCVHAPLRQILCVPQSLGGVHDGEQVHVVPSGRHTLVRPVAQVSCSAELQAPATASTTHAARARAPLTTGAMLSELRRCLSKACPDSLGRRMRVALTRPLAAVLSVVVVCLAAGSVSADPPAPTDPPNQYAGAKSTATFFLVAGAGALGTGYLAAAGAGAVGLAINGSQDSKYGGSCGGASGYAFIPLVGPLLALRNYPNHQVATYEGGMPQVLDCNGSRTALTVMVIGDEIVQIGGLAMALTGLVMHAVIAGKEGNAGSVSLSAGAEGAPMGLTLQAVTF
jgi:hypothetical protein